MLHSVIVVNKLRNIPVVVRPSDHHVASDEIRPLNARSIALSVLLGSHPPELPARAFVAMAELFGIPGGTMRTALSRMLSADEVIAVEGQYRLAGRLLDRQQAQDAGRRAPAPDWDHRWHTIVAAADQRDLAQRRRFRAAMANRRFGELRPDIWMRPSNLDRPPVEPNWIVTTGDLDGIDHDELTRRLWDLDTIAGRARRLLDEMAVRRARADWADPTSIPDLFTTSAAVVRFLRNEPLLPARLTPPDWPVAEVRAAYDGFEREHQRLLQAFLRRA